MKRNDFLSHVAWTGAGIFWTMQAGRLTGTAVAADAQPGGAGFVQISDSHIGFHQPANPNVSATLQEAVDAINALAVQPRFVVHTGDITHLSTPQQFDDAKHILTSLRAPLFTLPGEHDFIGNDPKGYFGAFGGAAMQNSARGWYSWDQDGIHYVALVNVFNFEKMGLLGADELSWLQKDLAPLKNDRPLVVFTHVPLYALYPQWGWTTEDGSRALALLSRFDTVTVLNGHIHQIVRHREGNIEFASAAATAYPQPEPGKAAKPGPVTLPKDSLLRAIGYRTVSLDRGRPVVSDRNLAP